MLSPLVCRGLTSAASCEHLARSDLCRWWLCNMVQLPRVLGLREWPQPSKECPVLLLIEKVTDSSEMPVGLSGSWGHPQLPTALPGTERTDHEAHEANPKLVFRRKGEEGPSSYFPRCCCSVGSVIWQGKDHQQGSESGVGTCNAKNVVIKTTGHQPAVFQRHLFSDSGLEKNVISPDDCQSWDRWRCWQVQRVTKRYPNPVHSHQANNKSELQSWYPLCSLWHHTDPGPISWAQTSCCPDFWLNDLDMLAWCLVAALVSVRIRMWLSETYFVSVFILNYITFFSFPPHPHLS